MSVSPEQVSYDFEAPSTESVYRESDYRLNQRVVNEIMQAMDVPADTVEIIGALEDEHKFPSSIDATNRIFDDPRLPFQGPTYHYLPVLPARSTLMNYELSEYEDIDVSRLVQDEERYIFKQEREAARHLVRIAETINPPEDPVKSRHAGLRKALYGLGALAIYTPAAAKTSEISTEHGQPLLGTLAILGATFYGMYKYKQFADTEDRHYEVTPAVLREMIEDRRNQKADEVLAYREERLIIPRLGG